MLKKKEINLFTKPCRPIDCLLMWVSPAKPCSHLFFPPQISVTSKLHLRTLTIQIHIPITLDISAVSIYETACNNINTNVVCKHDDSK